jgi:hypothetical protein
MTKHFFIYDFSNDYSALHYNKEPPPKAGVSNKCSTFIYAAFTQLDFVQQPVGLQSGVGLHTCCVVCLFFFCFLGLLLPAKAPVANVQTNASISIFFIMLF